MCASRQPAHEIRRAVAAEASLIEDLRLASLHALEMPGQPLATLRALMDALPDFHSDLIAAGRYFVADAAGDLIGGAGWGALPARLRLDRLIGRDARPAELLPAGGSVLLRGFFLDPDLGRSGAAAGLLSVVEAEAVAAGHIAADIVVPASSQLYYRSLGFRSLARLGLQIGREEVLPMLQMRKLFATRLSAAA
jgi:hypothetical protein